ncbi:hypothetical protein OIU79_005047 [Salix purpurea]|uniref:Uncharacterized protein n=1 Tax=Salix purpurea TaxID=77065 RepID=A0A9Q0UBK1_SALPP|nr:hypothetical protein OIU79_005047 [Salix purpurea]
MFSIFCQSLTEVVSNHVPNSNRQVNTDTSQHS